MNKINSVLKEALKKVKPSGKEAGEIEILLKKFTERLRKSIKNLGVDAEIFVGGSVAKGTSIKKKVYDADIFLRFNRKYEDISNLTEKILKGFKKTKIHGSRDYFRIKASRKIVLEIVPVLRIKSPKEARNITDLSYFHVNYAKRKFPKKIIDEIILAKAFCHAKNCYGAESYIRGFSGYGLELLVYHYKSFLNFLKAISKPSLNSGNQEKIIIDTEKKFRNKNEILMDVNSSKLQSPVILIDPTHRERNALAALSWETFRKFQKAGRKFLKKPSIRDFEKERVAIQGFGNAGYYFARLLKSKGYRIIAISDSKNSVHNPAGLDVEALQAWKEKKGSLANFAGAKTFPRDAVFGVPVDILIPAALENSLHKENASGVKAKVIFELANGPTTPEADAIFQKKGVVVVPDILTNAGGVTVSYFEWVQNMENTHWTEEEVNKKLHKKMTKAAVEVWDASRKYKTSLRIGAFVVALGRILKAMK